MANDCTICDAEQWMGLAAQKRFAKLSEGIDIYVSYIIDHGALPGTSACSDHEVELSASLLRLRDVS